MAGGPLIGAATVESGQLRTLPDRKTRSRIDPTPRIPPSGTADLVEPASLLVLYAPNLYRDIVQELKKGVDWLDQKALFESGH